MTLLYQALIFHGLMKMNMEVLRFGRSLIAFAMSVLLLE